MRKKYIIVSVIILIIVLFLEVFVFNYQSYRILNSNNKDMDELRISQIELGNT